MGHYRLTMKFNTSSSTNNCNVEEYITIKTRNKKCNEHDKYLLAAKFTTGEKKKAHGLL